MRAKIFVCIFMFFGLVLKAQENKSSRNKAEDLYKQARKEFSKFEGKHGKFIQTKNVLMHYLTWGTPDGIPLIWAHGSLTNGYELYNIADSLVKAGYYVIAIDYYGHGQTAIPTHEVSLYHIADDIRFLMDDLQIKKAVIGGWSRGGYISTAFYDAYPERVLGLVLEDGGSVSFNTNYHKMTPLKLDSTLRKIESDNHPDKVYESEFDAYYDIYDSSEEGSQFRLLAWIKKTNEGKWTVYSGVIEFFNMLTASQWANNILRPTRSPLFARSISIIDPTIIYRNLDVPILILDPISKDDFMPFEAENKSLKDAHPGLIIHKIYNDTGHNIHYQRPKVFIEDLTDFLAQVKIYHSLK